MSASLDQILERESPRLSPRAAPLASSLISGAALLLFLALSAQIFFRDGLASWSVGLVYVAYDTVLLGFTAWHMRAIAGRPALALPPARAAMPRPRLGVIVAAHNEARALPVTIDALMRQTDPPELIVIADDGSTDATDQLLADRYGLVANRRQPTPQGPELLWLAMPHGGKACALNRAISSLDCDIVLTVDADTLIEEHAIGAMRHAFASEPTLAAATGVLVPVCGKGPQARFFEWFQRYEYIRNFISRYAWMQLNSLLLISGAFAAFRREALLRVGGFDPACLVEDYELIHRIHRHSTDHRLGWTVRVIGEAQARTDAPETLAAFLRQRRRWFAGFLQTQRWNRDMVGNPRFGALGTAMMPVKTLDTLQPIYGLTAFFILLYVLITGQLSIALPILIVMLIKIGIDMSFHLWSLGIYRRWTLGSARISWPKAIAAALLEPFSFQLMRHAGAAWGWLTFVTGRQSWGRQNRGGIISQD